MRSTVTGNRVRELRNALQFTYEQMSSVLCVNASTLIKWERQKDERVCIEGIASHILAFLDRHADAINDQRASAILGSFLVGGPLESLYTMLELLDVQKRAGKGGVCTS